MYLSGNNQPGLTAAHRTRSTSWFECCSLTAAAEFAALPGSSHHHPHVYSLLIHFHTRMWWLCTPICSPHLSLVSFHTVFPCRALCTHCGSPQRMKDVCFICLIHAKEDSVFLLENTVLKYCLSGLPTSMKRLGFLCSCS